MGSFESFTLSPMSAGDIIDRAVRLYKRNFLAFVRIVLAPSLTAYVGRILFYSGLNNFSLVRGDARVALTSLMIFGGGVLWLVGETAFYAVLGGSSRSLIAHFFEGKPILARDVYRSVRERIWSLIGSVLTITIMVIAVSWMMILFLGIFALIFSAIASRFIAGGPQWVAAIYGFLSVAGLLVGMLLSFLMVYSRLVYVPQILMVEGKGVFGAINRSFQLARGELVRIAAVIIFWIYVAWSLWVLMAVPLGWYGYVAGVDITPFSENVPLWYQIAKQTLTQLSEILIWPIAMLCFTLLYINSRVRKEGYDIELLANKALAQPMIPQPSRPIDPPGFPDEPWSTMPSILDRTPERSVSTVPSAAVLEPQIPSPATPVIEFSSESLSIDEPIRQSALQSAAPQTKICGWCESPGAVEDRFCRVCGSVF
jgi:hypothetical protein